MARRTTFRPQRPNAATRRETYRSVELTPLDLLVSVLAGLVRRWHRMLRSFSIDA